MAGQMRSNEPTQDQDLGLLHNPPALQQPLQPLSWDGSHSPSALSVLETAAIGSG